MTLFTNIAHLYDQTKKSELKLKILNSQIQKILKLNGLLSPIRQPGGQILFILFIGSPLLIGVKSTEMSNTSHIPVLHSKDVKQSVSRQQANFEIKNLIRKILKPGLKI